MHKKINDKGFTLVEILAAIVILGVLMGTAIVSISYILSKSKINFYNNLEKQLILAAKSYYSDHKVLLPQSIGQTRRISIGTLVKNNYLKRGDVVDYGKAECDISSSYVKTIKLSKDDVIYTIFLQCPSYILDEEKELRDIDIDISISDVDGISNASASVTMSVDEEIDKIASYQYTIYKNDQVIYTSNNISGENQSTISKTIQLKKYVPGAIKVSVTVYDIYGNVKTEMATASIYDKGLPRCGDQKPSLQLNDTNDWINADSKETDRKITLKCIDGETKCLASSFSRSFTTDNRDSYVTILGKNNQEVNCPVTVMIDKTDPVCGSSTGSSTWTSGSRTVKVNCSDVTSGCTQGVYTKLYDADNESVKTSNITIKDKAGNTTNCPVNVYLDNEKPTCTVSGGSTSWITGSRSVTVTCNDGNGSGCKESSFTDTISTTVKTKTYTVYDNAGNKGTCTGNIYVDNTAPTTPTGGNIGTISGSDTNASIKTVATGSSDSHSGFKQYLYLVTNSSTVPSKNDSGFTASRSYLRACGKNYYAWVVAVDNVGNRSAVKSLGSTKDGANVYGTWSDCSKKCDGGTQTRTNSCALITTGLSQSCNTEISCKPAKPTISNPTGGNWVNYNFSLTVNTSTPSSSIGYWQWTYNTSSWTTFSNSATNRFVTTAFVAERNQPVYIRVCTKDGVCSDTASTYIRIDKTKPVYTSVAPYCGDIFHNGSRHYVKLYFSDYASGLGMRYVDSWDYASHVYHPNANYYGAISAADIIANSGSWLGFNHKVCDRAGNCNSWNDPKVTFGC